MDRRALLVIALGASAIACVAGPFAVIGQRHAPKARPPAPITHTAPPTSVAVVASVSTVESPAPPVSHVHTFRVADLSSDSRYTVASGTIGKKGFLGALAASGLSAREAHRVLVGFSGVKNLDRLSANDTFAYAKMNDHVVAFELVPIAEAGADALDFFQSREDDAAAPLLAKHVSIPIEKKRITAGITIGADLRASLASAGFEEAITNVLDDALDGHAELTDLRAGTRLRIVATEERIEGAFASYAPIDAVEYTPPPTHDAKPAVRVYWFAKGSSESHDAHDKGAHTRHGGYYDAQGRQPYHGAWRSPIPMARISSRFNPNRMHPILHTVMPHNGVDFAAPSGTPVYAASAGTIRSAGDGGPCGNMIQIEHAGGLISAYCHLSRFGPIIPGEHVETRQLIGYVGQTGRATGPHLHFAVKRANAAGTEIFIDPLLMRLDGVRVVGRHFQDDFDTLRKSLDAEIDSIALPVASPTNPNPEAKEPAENPAENE